MNWIYLSPHFDDVALSCGGLVWEQSHAGDEVSLWTVCGGKPQQMVHSPIIEELHTRWESGDQAIRIRKREDIRSCRSLNASYRHFNIPDCIYRVDKNNNPLYPTQEALFGSLNNYDNTITKKLVKKMDRLIPPEAQVVCPLAIGNHVDHQLTRQIAAQIGRSVWFYADFPYVLKNKTDISNYIEKGWVLTTFPITENGFQAWLQSVSAHRSQFSTFWSNYREMEADFRSYMQSHRGIPLWQPCHIN